MSNYRTDIPTPDDFLGMSNKNKGLAEFIKNCGTPLTVSIQGDWGVGKTSAMEYIKNEIEKTGAIPCIWFDTWQFSALPENGNIFLEFIMTFKKLLEEELYKITIEDKEEEKEEQEAAVPEYRSRARKVSRLLKAVDEIFSAGCDAVSNVGGNIVFDPEKSALGAALIGVSTILKTGGNAFFAKLISMQNKDETEKSACEGVESESVLISKTHYLNLLCDIINIAIDELIKCKIAKTYRHVPEEISLVLADMEKSNEESGSGKEECRLAVSSAREALGDDLETALEKAITAVSEMKRLRKKKYDEIGGDERAERLRQLREELRSISNISEDDERICIFIDDLDRLKPEMALEILEGIKNFVKYRKCVFVLAIDDEVITQGLKTKYGDEIADEKDGERSKAKKFFDKIIQVPFTINAKSHKIRELVEQMLPDTREKIRDDYITLLNELDLHNPRSIKRYFNLTELYGYMSKAKEGAEQADNNKNRDEIISFCTFIVVILQIEREETYKEMFSVVMKSDTAADAIAELNKLTEKDSFFEKARERFSEINEKNEPKGNKNWLKDIFEISNYSGEFNDKELYIKRIRELMENLSDADAGGDFSKFREKFHGKTNKELAENFGDRIADIKTSFCNISIGFSTVRPYIFVEKTFGERLDFEETISSLKQFLANEDNLFTEERPARVENTSLNCYSLGIPAGMKKCKLNLHIGAAEISRRKMEELFKIIGFSLPDEQAGEMNTKSMDEPVTV